MTSKINVTYHQRKVRPGFNYSIESIFEDLRFRLRDVVVSKVEASPLYNDGYYSKLINILAARQHQGLYLNHITGETHFLNLLMRKKDVILTIHDCGMVNRKRGLAQIIIRWLYLTGPVKKARYVTTVSETTKQEIIRHTGCPQEKIVVIPVPVGGIYKPVSRNFRKHEPTILHIGTGYNKNLLRLIEALQGIRCRLVIVGKLSQEQKEKLDTCAIHWENRYGLTQQEMYRQYVVSDMLCFISTFEGFGMPIVEANAVGRPVLTSNLSSMPEVAGDAACLVDPYNVEDIRRGLKLVINDDSYREQLIQNGFKNQLRFDGDRIAHSYYDLYCTIYRKQKSLNLSRMS